LFVELGEGQKAEWFLWGSQTF